MMNGWLARDRGRTALRLADLLRRTPLDEARPEVLVDSDRAVTWVHSSEIYEIAPLLDGGEVLLTTGLGLVGADDTALARYAEGIAARDAVAIALELGRTFVHPPPALVDACARSGLGLVALHAVVPFARIARVANELILDHEATALRMATELTRGLADDLRHRTGVRAMVARLRDAVGSPVQLVDGDGKVHAGPEVVPEPAMRQEILLSTGTWGWLVAAATDDAWLPLLLERGADAVQIAVADLQVGSHLRDAARTLLRDLVHGAVSDSETVGRRATALGVHADRPVTAVVAVLADDADVRQVEAVTGALQQVVRTDLVAAEDDRVLAVVDAAATRRATATRLLDALVTRAGGAPAVRYLAVGTPAPRLDRVPESFGVALGAAATAVRLGSERRLLLAADVALDRLLLEAEDAALERLVARVLGPLLEHDAKRRAELLPTLVAYLGAGRSKAATAARLGVRRQTVHERLTRIVALLDLDEQDATAFTNLEVAVRAWQIRTAAARRA